jgi:hypothetical protein
VRTYSCSDGNYGVVHTFFGGFEKYRVFDSNPKGLGFIFIDKRLFIAKMGRKSILHHREAHILARFHIMVLYIFFEVLKNIEFQLKPQGVQAFGFTDKRLLIAKMS